jgi:hypothetical protein
VPWLFSCFLLGPLRACADATSYIVTFDRERYEMRVGDAFPVKVLINPLPPPGIFSFGVRMTLPSTNAEVVGAASVQAVTDLSFNGPRAFAPVIGTGPGFAAVKGTADFFRADRPASTNALLVTFLVHNLASEPYQIGLEFFNTLGPTEQIFVDGKGSVLDSHLSFSTAAVVPITTPIGQLEVQSRSTISLDRQTGLFNQTVRVSNGYLIPISGFQLLVSNFPVSWQVWNAHGVTNGIPYFIYKDMLSPGEYVDLRVEFRIPDRNPLAQPSYEARISQATNTPPEVTGNPFAITPRMKLSDGSFLLEFDSILNRSYSIQYSYDLTAWNSTFPAITGNGSRLQWIDYGPPKTDRPPSQATNRYYRVLLLP